MPLSRIRPPDGAPRVGRRRGRRRGDPMGTLLGARRARGERRVRVLQLARCASRFHRTASYDTYGTHGTYGAYGTYGTNLFTHLLASHTCSLHHPRTNSPPPATRAAHYPPAILQLPYSSPAHAFTHPHAFTHSRRISSQDTGGEARARHGVASPVAAAT